MNCLKHKNIDYKRIGLHVLFWLVITISYDLLATLIRGSEFGKTLLVDFLFYTPTDILGVYVVLYILIPNFLLQKKYIHFSVAVLVWFFLLTVLIALPYQYFGLNKMFHSGQMPPYPTYFKHAVLETITIKVMITGVASAVKIVRIWIKTQKRQQKLIQEKLETELKLREAELRFLKSQINPHFLFNALNNLYSLTLTKSDKAPDVVLKISALLDYMLYECNVKYIELKREIESIKNYIELQKIRYGNNTNITFEVSGRIEHSRIAPLLILPLVENAFKHGLDKNVGKGFVDIRLIKTNDLLHIIVRNSLKGENNHERQGIGLQNLQKRLELQYADRHRFTINETQNEFRADLEIIIN